MTDYTSMSREDLIKLLMNKDELETDDGNSYKGDVEPENDRETIDEEYQQLPNEKSIEDNISDINITDEFSTEKEPEFCKYKPSRGNQKPCPELCTTPYGYCNRHKGTIQAKNAKSEWEKKEILESNLPTQNTPENQDIQVPQNQEPNRKVFSPDFSQGNTPEIKMENNKLLKGLYDGESTSGNNSQYKKLGNSKQTEPQKNHRSSQKPVTTRPAIVRKKEIFRNKFGRFEDPKTHIIFDPKTTEAFGVQRKDGSITDLTPSKIDICKKNGWKYSPPVEDSDESEEIEYDSDLIDSGSSSDEESGSSSESEESDEDESESSQNSSIIEEYYTDSESE